jgi:lipopolysaccharide transport system permease protein
MPEPSSLVPPARRRLAEDATPDGAPKLTVIEPGGRWALRLGELSPYRELLYFLVWRDLKVRYRQTAVGAAWAVIQPVALTLVFTLALGRLQGISQSNVPYALFVLSGLVPWALFSQTLSRASDSLVSSAQLLQKVYFPRLLLPIAAAGTPLIDYAIGFAVLLVALAVGGVAPTPAVLLCLPLTALAIAASLAAGVWLAALNVRYRDVRHIVPFLVQVWFFATPIIYSLGLIPEQLRWAYFLNPMAGVIAGFRFALLGDGVLPVLPVLVSAVVSAAVLVTGIAHFRRVERGFADVI